MVNLSYDAAIALSFATTFMIVGTIVFYGVLGQVNARLPEKERLSYLGFHLAKNRRIAILYRQFFPKGRLLLAYRGCVLVAILCMILVVILDN